MKTRRQNGAPKKPPEQRHSAAVLIRLLEDDYARVRSYCQAQDIAMGVFARQAIREKLDREISK